MKCPKYMWIAVIALVIFLLLGLGTSHYMSISTDLGDSVKPSAIFDLKTDLGCVAGSGTDKESYYEKQDGTGYGICGVDKLVNDQMAYKLLDDDSNAQLGD